MSVRLDDKLTRVYEPGTAVGSSVVESVGARDLLFRLSGVEPFCATQLLDMYPHLWQSREDVLLLAAEEFARRRLAGESISPDAFADQFRQWRDAVRREVEIERRVAAYESDTDGPDVAWPRPGGRFLHYEIVRLIGRGGFSRVYLARNLNLGGRRVVLKLCPSESTDEARTLGSLQHPNIGDVLSMDVDPQRGLTAICMPFCSLATLADVVAAVQHHRDTTGRMPRRAGFLLQTVRHVHDEADVECPDDSAGLAAGQRWIASHGFVDGVLEIGRQLATALAVTHRRKLLHRDIKPSNVLITPSGRAILFDFNLSSDCDQITNVAGTFAYMAPEALKVVARRTRLVSTEYDVRSDLYSLGATLYELLAGRHPFDRTPPHLSHQAAAELLLEKQALGPRPLHEVNTAVDRQVSCVVERLLAFDPGERFQTADELLETLNDLLRPTVKLRRSWQSRPALRIGTAGVAVAVSLFVAGTVVTWYRPFPPDANLPHVAARSTTPVASPRGPLAGAATPEPGPQNVRQTTAAERNRSIDRADQQHPTAATTSPLPRPMLVADQVPPASVAAGVHLAELSKTSAESDNPDAPAVVSSSERSADARPAVPTADGARKPTSPASAPRADAATEPAAPADGAPPKPVVVLTAQNTEATAGDAHRTPPASPGKLPKDESAQSARHEEPEAGRKELAIRITDPERGSIVLPNARRIGRSPTDGTDKTPKAAEPTVKEQQSKPNTPRRPKQRPQQPPLRLANLIPEPNVPAPPLRIQNDNGEPTASPGQSRKAHEASRRIYLLALTASSEGDFKHAITVAEDALLAGHQSVALRNNLGYCYWKTGDIEKARDHFAAALKSRSLRREEEPVVRLNWAIAATECALLDGRPLVMAEFGPLREMNRDPMAQLMTAKAMCINARSAKNNPSVAQSNFLLAGTLVRRAAELDAPTKAIRELANQFPELMGSDDFKIALRMVSRQLVPGEAAPVRLIPVSD